MKRQVYKLKSKVWVYPGMAGWNFLSVSPNVSEEISKKYSNLKKGWGSIPVEVSIGKTAWNTSIFPDKKSKTYVLPLKKEIRKICGITEGDEVDFRIRIFSL